MHTQTTIIRIPLDKLIAHPENPNRMSKQTYEKLKRHIAQSHNYEPLIVRRHPEIENSFEIINGHHRAKALKEIGETFADCVQWQIDDDQARILLATLNRLGGKDELGAKVELIKNLSEKFGSKELSKLLPDTKQTIEKLRDITSQISNLKSQISNQPDNAKLFLNTLVFFLSDKQIKTVEAALEKAMLKNGSDPFLTKKAEKMAEAITRICERYFSEKS